MTCLKNNIRIPTICYSQAQPFSLEAIIFNRHILFTLIDSEGLGVPKSLFRQGIIDISHVLECSDEGIDAVSAGKPMRIRSFSLSRL